MKIEFDLEKAAENQLRLINKLIETRLEHPDNTKYLKISTEDSVGMAELKQTMNNLIDDQGPVMIVDEVIARISHNRLDKKTVFDLLEQLKKQGEICEPKDGYVKVG